MIAFVLWASCGLLAAYIAGAKQRTAAWAFLGFLLGPLGVIIVALLPELAPPEDAVRYGTNEAGESVQISGPRACPFCAETIQPAAVVCKHCGRDVRCFKPQERKPTP